jgi:hypothetical protein
MVNFHKSVGSNSWSHRYYFSEGRKETTNCVSLEVFTSYPLTLGSTPKDKEIRSEDSRSNFQKWSLKSDPGKVQSSSNSKKDQLPRKPLTAPKLLFIVSNLTWCSRQDYVLIPAVFARTWTAGIDSCSNRILQLSLWLRLEASDGPARSCQWL